MTGSNRRLTPEQISERLRIENMVRRGLLDRRTFIQGFTALGLGTTFAGSAAFDSANAQEAAPKRGGRLRAASGQHGPDDTLDPAVAKAGIDYARGFQIYNTLVRLDENIRPRPELALSWEPNQNATEWVFELQAGVEFHDGKPFGAGDVVYTMQRHLDPDVGSTGKDFLAGVREVTADGDRIVRFMLESPNADFPVNLGVFQMMIVPEGKTDFNENPVGTGPFIMTEFRPGIRSLAVRNPNYWREGPWLDELEWFGITEPTARLNALLAGDIQLMAELDAKAIPDVEGRDDVRVIATKAGQFADVVMMRDKAPFDNLDVVTAIKLLFDREKVVERVFKGYGMVGNDHPISPVDPMYCDELPIRPYDPEQARFLLNRAGVLGQTLELHASEAAHANAVDLALMLQREARAIGLNIDVVRAPADGYWSDVWMQKPMHMAGWNMRPTADIMMSIALTSDAAWNESQFKNERFDALLIEARGVLDEARRKEMFCELQRMAHEEAGLAIPAFVDYLDAAASHVRGIPKVPLGPLGGYSFPEYIWLDT